MKETGEILASFTYDENGIRTSKTINNEITYYTTIDGRITSQYTINQNSEKINEMEFIYDNGDEVVGAVYEGDVYYYIKNALGDVTGIISGEGNYVCQYEYDAWGNPKKYKKYVSADNFAVANPIQYRGYYYDEELGFYYLQSRYYIPCYSRFLNSDLPVIAKFTKDRTAGTNLFAYCNNDPVNNKDVFGYSAIAAGAGAGALIFSSSSIAFSNPYTAFIAIVLIFVFAIAIVILPTSSQADAIEKSKIIAKADAKIREKIKKGKSYFWIANRKDGYVTIGKSLTEKEALLRVASGKDVFASSKSKAKSLAKKASVKKAPLGPDIDKDKEYVLGYYWHYHTNPKNGSHIFYL